MFLILLITLIGSAVLNTYQSIHKISFDMYVYKALVKTNCIAYDYIFKLG